MIHLASLKLRHSVLVYILFAAERGGAVKPRAFLQLSEAAKARNVGPPTGTGPKALRLRAVAPDPAEAHQDHVPGRGQAGAKRTRHDETYNITCIRKTLLVLRSHIQVTTPGDSYTPLRTHGRAPAAAPP